MLEKKYSSDRDGSYAYINAATATTIPLTPYMMKEWARAIVSGFRITFDHIYSYYTQYDGIATVEDPPRTAAFDPANRVSSLSSRARAGSSASANSSGDISAASLAQILGSVVSVMRPDLVMPATPKTIKAPGPPASAPGLDTSSIIFNTPSKLERFLRDAERNGIPGVLNYHLSLSIKGYGPDILHMVNAQELTETGVSPGDAIRLREYANKWWAEEHRRVAKRPHAMVSEPTETRVALTPAPTPLTPHLRTSGCASKSALTMEGP